MWNSERQIQESFFTYVREYSILYPKFATIFAIPNGGRREKIDAILMRRGGVLSGVWDVQVPYPSSNSRNTKMWIEFKYGKNKLTDNQILFKDNLSRISPNDIWCVYYNPILAFNELCIYSGIDIKIEDNNGEINNIRRSSKRRSNGVKYPSRYSSW